MPVAMGPPIVSLSCYRSNKSGSLIHPKNTNMITYDEVKEKMNRVLLNGSLITDKRGSFPIDEALYEQNSVWDQIVTIFIGILR